MPEPVKRFVKSEGKAAKTDETGTTKEADVKSIRHALDTLNNIAQTNSTAVRDMVDRDFRQLRDLFYDAKPDVKSAFGEISDVARESVTEARDKTVKATKDGVEKIDRSAHQHPWAFMAGIAAVSALGAYLLGRRSR